MRKSRNGFTLLEIIIVIIIIGVLTSLALPRLFSMVEKARAAEAWAFIGSIRRAVENCRLMNDNALDKCGNLRTIGFADTPAITEGYFTYGVGIDIGDKYGIRAVYQEDGGQSRIYLIVDNDNNTITRCGIGIFSDIGPCS